MRRLNVALLASLHLCSSTGAHARQHSFSIQDDVLAYPQFEVVYSDTYISEADALALLESNGSPHPTNPADFSTATASDLTNAARESSAVYETAAAGQDGFRSSSSDILGSDGVDDDRPQISETYELINVPPSKYFCAVPVLAPSPALNQTEAELAKAAEMRELGRASARGWELVNAMDGTCLYYMSGWWSYSFCYGKEIVQFHAVPNSQKGGPPVKDPNSHEYVLGRTHPEQRGGGAHRRKGEARQQKKDELDPDAADAADAESTNKGLAPPNTELQVKGDQRYLVQRLEGGTLCDLTDRERTIEVQYHCAPNAAMDRISFIKEITTCTYLMVVATPRLCTEVAFQPPEQQRAHPVSCRLVISNDADADAWRERKTIEAMELMGQKKEDQAHQHQQSNKFAGMTIGGVTVGGRKILAAEDGQPAAKLPPPRHFGGGKQGLASPLVEILAHARSQAEGGGEEALSDEELKNLDLEPKAIEKLRDELKKLAGDKGWKLEVVEVRDGHQEIRGVIDGDDEEEGDERAVPKQADRGRVKGGQSQGKGKAVTEGQQQKDPKGQEEKKNPGSDQGPEEKKEDPGSEETFFKEEL